MTGWDPVQHLQTIDAYLPDDVFLCSTSFEPRCMNVVTRLSPKYRARNSIALWFEGPDVGGVRRQHLNEILGHLTNCTETNPLTLRVNKYEPLELIRCLNAMDWRLKEGARITCDITTLTTPYLLVTSRYLLSLSDRVQLRLLYTHHKDPNLRNYRASWGVASIMTLPFISNMTALEHHKKLLIIFVGMDTDRPWALWKSIEPDTAVIVTVEDLPGSTGRPKSNMHKRLLEQPNVRRETIPSLSPDAAEALLSQYASDATWKDHLLIVAPLGYKSQSLGLLLFLLKAQHARKVIVLYAAPVEYGQPLPFEPTPLSLELRVPDDMPKWSALEL